MIREASSFVHPDFLTHSAELLVTFLMKRIGSPINLQFFLTIFLFQNPDLSEPALDVAEAGVGLTSPGLTGLLGWVRGKIEPGEPHPPPEKWTPLNLHISKCLVKPTKSYNG